MTMQLTMRRLNDEGLVWTDHKLANFDIVPDQLAPTGHRMVLFDHDGIRVAGGATKAERARNARQTQQIVDSLDGRSPYELYNKMAEDRLPDFNDAVFGKAMGAPITPRANLGRTEFMDLNKLSSTDFGSVVEDFGRRTGKKIPYNPVLLDLPK